MNARWSTVAAGMVIGLLCGCAGTVTPGQRPDKQTAAVPGVSSVSFALTSEVNKQQAETPQFSGEELANRLRAKLQAKGLASPGADHRVEIVVTDIRVRGAFSAIMFGFMAGDDHVDGKVRLLDGSGREIRSSAVHASYAFGGIAGGQDSVRMTWLYDKFTDLALADLEQSVGPALVAGSISTSPNAVQPRVAASSVAIDDVAAVPVSENGRNAYREWLQHKSPRAFIISENGWFYPVWGTKAPNAGEPSDPTERGLKRCRDAERPNCRVYAVDDRVMYVAPSSVSLQKP